MRGSADIILEVLRATQEDTKARGRIGFVARLLSRSAKRVQAASRGSLARRQLQRAQAADTVREFLRKLADRKKLDFLLDAIHVRNGRAASQLQARLRGWAARWRLHHHALEATRAPAIEMELQLSNLPASRDGREFARELAAVARQAVFPPLGIRSSRIHLLSNRCATRAHG